jgi:hypothetical protein
MKLAVTLVILLGCMALVTACTKGENGENTSAQKQQLVAGKWQISARTATTHYMGNDTTIDLYPEMDECDKDDFILFAANGTGTADENADKCSGDNQVESFTWMLLQNDTKLLVADSNPDTMDVLQLTGAQLKLQLTSLNTSGVPIYTVETYNNIR